MIKKEENEIVEQEEEQGEQYEPEGPDEQTSEKLRKELIRCKKERQEYLDGWQRCQADAINIQRHEEQRRGEYAERALEPLMRELVEVLNMFHHAFSSSDETNPYTRGFRHIYTQLETAAARYGLERIQAVGAAFDATRHEAVEATLVLKEKDDNMVTEEVEAGYMLHGNVIRPSKVIVGTLQK